MATGDVKNNLRKLIKELKQLNYPIGEVNVKGLSLGTPASFLPILHYVFLDFSVDLTEFFAKDYELYGKTDLRFMETVYKILRDVFHYKPPLTREQFLTIGFAERKIIQLSEILKKCREKHTQLNPKTTKVDKKYVSKVKSMISGGEKQENVGRHKVLQEIQSFPKPANNGERTIALQQKTKAEEVHKNSNSKNTGKSILKNKKDEEKENKKSFRLSAAGNENMNERGKIDEDVQPFSRLKSGIKNVRWEEEQNGSVTLFKPGLGPSNTSITEHGSLVGRQPLPTTVGNALSLPPRVIPAPVSITTAPEPSPDLMLTPMPKSGHQAIPLSGSKDIPVPSHSRGNEVTDVSLIDLTESASVKQPIIVRHTITEKPIPNNIPSIPKESELKSLRILVTEMQEKLDTVLAQNNEMSARIVLLENKVKLLEESRCSHENSCGKLPRNEAFSSSSEHVQQLHLLTKPIAEPCTQRMTQQAINESIPAKELSQFNTHSSSSSRRLLLDEFNESQPTSLGETSQVYSQNNSEEAPFNKGSPSLIEISDDDIENISTNQSKTSPKRSPLQQLNGQGLEVISPLQTSSDIHLKFSDPTTTATILNVERRLQETRAMLANATRFPQPNAF